MLNYSIFRLTSHLRQEFRLMQLVCKIVKLLGSSSYYTKSALEKYNNKITNCILLSFFTQYFWYRRVCFERPTRFHWIWQIIKFFIWNYFLSILQRLQFQRTIHIIFLREQLCKMQYPTRKMSYCIHFIHASQFLRSVYIIISDTTFFVVLIWPSCGFSLIYNSVNNRYVVATILEQKELLFRIFWRTKSDKSTIACIQGKVDDNFKAY